MTDRPLVRQYTAVLAARDAVSDHVVAFHEILVGMGCEAEIRAAHVHPERRGLAGDFRRAGDRPADLVVYHLSTGTPVADHVAELPTPLVLVYHNITPASFYEGWEPHIAAELDHGRRQLARLARRARLVLADSEFNAEEVRALTDVDVVVSPILFDPASLASPVPAPAPASDRARTWLFVGRIAPNKAQHDLVVAMAAADANDRLVLVGASSSAAYQAALERLIGELGIADRVHIAGTVPADELAAWFHRADVFVCLSEHEGFCVPLLEAMQHRLPIVAFDGGAVAETLAGAGLVLRDKSPASVAAAVDRVLDDDRLRDALVRAGTDRLARFDPERTGDELRRLLAPLVGVG